MSKDLSYGLVLDLDMGTLQDYSGNTVTNNGTTVVADINNRLKARSFVNSSSQYISVANDSSLQISGDITIAAWVKFDNHDGSYQIISKDSNSNERAYGLDHISVNGFHFVTNGGAGNNYVYWDFGTPATIGQWYFVVGKKEGTTHYISVDGADFVSNSGGTTTATGNSTVQIGAREYSTSRQFIDGDIFLAKIWNRGLSQEETVQLYNDIKHNYQGLFDGLVAGYDFKKDAKDFSDNEYDLTDSGTASSDNQFDVVGAREFSSGDYLEVTGINSGEYTRNTNYTVSMWIKTSTTGYQELFDRCTGSSAYGARIYVVSSSGYINYWNRSSSAHSLRIGSISVTDGNWHHIVMTYDGSNTKGYIDGVLDDGGTNNIASGSSDTTATTVTLGIYAINHTSNPLIGVMGGVMVYDRIISQDEMKQIYDLTKKDFVYPLPQHRVGGISE